MKFPGLDLIKEVFKKLSEKHDTKDLVQKGIRTAAAGGQALVDKGLQEFPKPLIRQLSEDIYSALASQDIADGISMTVRSFDSAKVQQMITQALDPLKQDEIAERIVDMIQKAPATGNPLDNIEMQLEGLIDSLPLPDMVKGVVNTTVKVFFLQNRAEFEEMRDLPKDQAVQKFKDIVDSFPTDALADIVSAFTDEATPERVGKMTRGAVGKLPSPNAVTEIVHKVGQEASRTFNKIATSQTPDEAKQHLDGLKERAADIVEKSLEDDKASKKTFKPGTGSSDFDL